MNVSSFNANNPYELLISQIIQIERQPQLALLGKRSEQTVFKTVLSDFDSTLSALNTSLDKLTDTLANPFQARAATVPEGAGFGVTASDSAAPGSHTLQVERLASTDTRLSQQFTSADGTLRSFFDTNGAQTFTIEVASPTDEDPDQRVGIEVTVNPEGTTDAEILTEIGAAINDAMSAAVDEGTIQGGDRASASVMNETSDTARFSLRSGGTGFANRLSFTDSANGLLGVLDIDNAGVVAGTSGGQVTAVGTSETDSDLNSRFVLDGLTLYRSTNEVTDAIEGLTLSLQSVGDVTSFRVGSDGDSIVASVKDFIANYNATLNFIKNKSEVDPESGARGDFAGDASITSLRFGMRNESLTAVESQSSDAPSELADLGIEINDDGTLQLTDEEKLIAAAEADSDAVQSFFAADDGLATRLQARLDIFLDTGGILDNRLDVAEARISRYNTQIERWDERLTQREDQLRAQYASLQETIATLQSQQDSLVSFYF